MTIPAGTVLHLRWAAANIDPDEFECPFELRLDRKAVTRHLTFSAGPRVCPGAGISRIEQQVAWERLTERLSDIQYAPENKLLHQPGIMLGTLKLNLLIEAAKKGSFGKLKSPAKSSKNMNEVHCQTSTTIIEIFARPGLDSQAGCIPNILRKSFRGPKDS